MQDKLNRKKITLAIFVGGTLGIILAFIFVAITLPWFVIRILGY